MNDATTILKAPQSLLDNKDTANSSVVPERRYTFDYSYDSFDPTSTERYDSQEKVFSDLGLFVMDNAWEGNTYPSR